MFTLFDFPFTADLAHPAQAVFIQVQSDQAIMSKGRNPMLLSTNRSATYYPHGYVSGING